MPGSHITGRAAIEFHLGRRFVDQVGQPGAHLGRGDHGLRRQLRPLADLHQLDEARDHTAVPGKAGQRLDFILILAAQHDGVQLDLLEARGERGVEAGDHAGEIPAPGEPRKALGDERIDGDRDSPQPGLPQGPRQFFEPGRVGRHGQIGEAEGGQESHQIHDPRVQERFAPRQAHPPHPGPDEPRDHHLPGLVVEPVVEVAVVAVRTAINTGQIAAIGQREAHAAGRCPRGWRCLHQRGRGRQNR